jgi:hypothetical protein
MERHRFDPLSAVFGVLFVGLGAAFMSEDVDVLDLDVRVAVAVVLLFVGLLIAGLIFRRPEGEVLSPGSEPDENQPTQPLAPS